MRLTAPTKPRLSRKNTPKSNRELRTVRVRLEERSYDILIGAGWIEGFGGAIRKAGGNKPSSYAMVFTSPRIGGLHFAALERSLANAGFTNIQRHDIPDGEPNKNLSEYVKGMEALCFHFNPDTEVRPVVINLGGGVVEDIGGFIAGTYGRGNAAAYVQIPTTLLACVDSSVGGKVGVNVMNFKNQAGLFYQPHLVLADLALLDTLEDAEMRSGLAEVVKYGVVCDAKIFELLEKHMDAVLKRDKGILQTIVERCCAIKARIVEKDERDSTGARMVLNFGHTIGHAIESVSNFEFRHGEAVSIGMLGATRMACELGVCNPAVYDRLSAMIQKTGLPVTAAGKNLSVREVMKAMEHDKKSVGGLNCFVLPTRLGKSCLKRGIAAELVERTVKSCLSA